jgi:uncharacterized protein
MSTSEKSGAFKLQHADVAPGTAPHLHPEVQGFWDSLRRGELSVQRCADCGTLRFPLSPNCHECLSGEYTWEAIDPHGVVDVAIQVHRAVGEQAPSGISLLDPWRAIAPYKTGVVDMVAGVRLPGRILCECGDALKPGAEVVAVTMDAALDTTVYGFVHGCHDLSEKR